MNLIPRWVAKGEADGLDMLAQDGPLQPSLPAGIIGRHDVITPRPDSVRSKRIVPPALGPVSPSAQSGQPASAAAVVPRRSAFK